MTQARGRAATSGRPGTLRLAGCALVGLVLVLAVNRFVVSAYRVPTASMAPTLTCGDVVVVRRRVGALLRGSVVVFHAPAALDAHGRPDPEAPPETAYADSGDEMGNPPTGPLLQQVHLKPGRPGQVPARATFVKRVVAVAGDVVSVRDGHALLGRTVLREPWLPEPSSTSSGTDFGPFTVPLGTVFLLGDNRAASVDSRQFGPVPTTDVVGVAEARLWPPARIGTLGRDAPGGAGCGPR